MSEHETILQAIDTSYGSLYNILSRQGQLIEQLCAKAGITVHVNPMPPALQEKLLRLGFGNWVPTPGVNDEDTELYLSLDANTHLYVGPVSLALGLSDEDLKMKLLEFNDPEVQKAAQAEYERRRVK